MSRIIDRLTAAFSLVLLVSAAAAAQEPVRWADLDRALVASDTFSFRMNGERLGTQVVTLERTDDGLRFEETSTLPHMNQTTEVLFGAEPLAMRSVRQTGRAMGNDMRISVDYAPDRATGTALTPAGGPVEIAIDAATPAGVIDDNVLTALLPAIDWTPTTDVVVPVFHSGRNAAAELRLRVTGTQPVEVPAGAFDTYRVEMTGGDTPIVFYVESGAPHRLVRVEVVGAPIEIVRLH